MDEQRPLTADGVHDAGDEPTRPHHGGLHGVPGTRDQQRSHEGGQVLGEVGVRALGCLRGIISLRCNSRDRRRQYSPQFSWYAAGLSFACWSVAYVLG